MEIERKFLIKELPANLTSYPCHHITQAYLNRNPVLRIRKQDDSYFVTYKGSGMMSREEFNEPLDKNSFEHLLSKADPVVITKTRYLIPIESPEYASDFTGPFPDKLVIELDIFEGVHAPLIMAEVEFPDEASANAFIMPDWFKEEVTQDPHYHNSNLSNPDFQ
ncbi:MAG: CYTH domain-containing protein [Lachnospiraceae bacterium]|nr:CYTH domain-containing protein [Candidatus Merdinaster equi]